MSDSVIIIVANDSYRSQVKSLMTNCVRQGAWRGDFCLVSAQDCDPSDMENRGIAVMRAPDDEWTMQTKFHIFSDYFKKWKRVLCLDCDVLIQGDLNDAFDGMAKKLPAILFDGPEDGSILHNWEHFDSLHGAGPDAHPELYKKMQARFPHIDKPILTAGAIFFAPETIPAGTVEALQAVAEEFKVANAGHTDQPVYNLVLYDKMAPMGKDFCTWFAFDYPENRVPCPARGWRGDEEPVILHYWDMYSPWLEKMPGAGGHFNHRLNRVCHEIYLENLNLFEDTFPVST